jgi:hypothetical protein
VPVNIQTASECTSIEYTGETFISGTCPGNAKDAKSACSLSHADSKTPPYYMICILCDGYFLYSFKLNSLLRISERRCTLHCLNHSILSYETIISTSKKPFLIDVLIILHNLNTKFRVAHDEYIGHGCTATA